MHNLESFRHEVVAQLMRPCTLDNMAQMSAELTRQYLDKMQNGEECMLPSFCHSLPTGQETGTFVCIDMGGSTCRVALVKLRGRGGHNSGMTIERIRSNKIDEGIRQLAAADFFQWMATKIHEMLEDEEESLSLQEHTIPVGISWSFPIEQTSHRSGRVQPMGKGFRCHEGVLGEDLAKLIEAACQQRGLNVRIDAIINDSSATLLSNAYKNSSTVVGLILGTGTNAAIHLPIEYIGKQKFGLRHATWFGQAQKVIVNTELSMFGKDILPRTKWDEALNQQHALPNFQPLEYMTAGRYLGEIFRLVIVEAIADHGLFQSNVIGKLAQRYTVAADVLASLEIGQSGTCRDLAIHVQSVFELDKPPTEDELSFLRAIAECLSARAASYTVTATHALLSLLDASDIVNIAIAVDGFVMCEYPGFRNRCESLMTSLQEHIHGTRSQTVTFEPAHEASILGAAVAVAIAGVA